MPTATPDASPHSAAQRRQRPPRPWPVTVIGWLLLIEMAGFLFVAALYLGLLGRLEPILTIHPAVENTAQLTGSLFGALGLLAFLVALGFFRLVRGAWVNAVLIQGVGLLLALGLYFRSRPTWAYGMMVYGIVMVLYLHQADVQNAFRVMAPSDEERR